MAEYDNKLLIFYPKGATRIALVFDDSKSMNKIGGSSRSIFSHAQSYENGCGIKSPRRHKKGGITYLSEENH